MYRHLDTRIVVARKPDVCYITGVPINKGDSYTKEIGTLERGKLISWKLSDLGCWCVGQYMQIVKPESHPGLDDIKSWVLSYYGENLEEVWKTTENSLNS